MSTVAFETMWSAERRPITREVKSWVVWDANGWDVIARVSNFHGGDKWDWQVRVGVILELEDHWASVGGRVKSREEAIAVASEVLRQHT